jgi:two-component system, NtrC family, sensor kinase
MLSIVVPSTPFQEAVLMPSSNGKLLLLLRSLLVFSVLAPALFFGLSAWLSYRDVFTAAENRAQHMANLVEEHTLKVFETIRLVLQQTDEKLADLDTERIRTARLLWDDLKALQQSLDQVDSIFVTDREGRNILTTRAFPAPPIDFSDRDYFLAQKNATSRGLYVGQAYMGRISKQPIFNFSIPRSSESGEFEGVIGISAFTDYFEKFYASVGDARDNFSIGLVREDGHVLVRYPADEGNFQPRQIAFVDAIQGRTHASISAVSPFDGLERLMTFVKVKGFPVYAAYGIDRTSILQQWHSRLGLFGLLAATVGFLMFSTTWVAHRRALEEARTRASALQAQRLEAIGQLTGGVAHDFNNLLTIISGNLELAERRTDLEGIRRMHKTIRHAVDRGAGLTRQLLAFSRRQPLNPQTLDVNNILETVQAWIGRGMTESIQITFDLADDLGAVRLDPGEFEAALLNLAVNARDAMSNGGKLTFISRNAQLSESDIARLGLSLLPGPYVEVSIEDTGTGMSPEVLGRVYEPFFTTKEIGKGTGLGLSQVYGFVQQSGGGILIRSERGKGTRVSLYLPRSDEPVAVQPPSATEQDVCGSGIVLLVEDNDEVRMLTTSMLQDLGYTPVVARSGVEALAMLRAGEPIDLVLSDIVMPRGISGVDLAQQALTSRPKIKVLLTTGSPDSSRAQQFPVLPKPFTNLELGVAIKQVLQ